MSRIAVKIVDLDNQEYNEKLITDEIIDCANFPHIPVFPMRPEYIWIDIDALFSKNWSKEDYKEAIRRCIDNIIIERENLENADDGAGAAAVAYLLYLLISRDDGLDLEKFDSDLQGWIKKDQIHLRKKYLSEERDRLRKIVGDLEQKHAKEMKPYYEKLHQAEKELRKMELEGKKNE